MKQLCIIKTNSVMNGCLFPHEHFPIVLGMSFEHNILRKTYSEVHVSEGILDFLYLRLTKNLNLLEPSVMGTRTWSFYFVT